jgi:hypothetical protein
LLPRDAASKLDHSQLHRTTCPAYVVRESMSLIVPLRAAEKGFRVVTGE